MLFTLSVDQENVVSAFFRSSQIDILADLNESFRAENQRASVAPGPQAIRGKPVHTEIVGGPVPTRQRAVTEIIQFRVLRMRIVPDPGQLYFRVFLAGEMQVLLNLMASDIT